MRLIKWVLYGKYCFLIDFLVSALVNRNNSVGLAVRFPNVIGVVFEKAFEYSIVVDPLDIGDIFRSILEDIEHIELLDLILFYALELEVRRIIGTIPSIHYRLDIFETNQVVDQHQDHRIR